MTTFKNKREIYQALVEGKKIKNINDSLPMSYAYISKDGDLVDGRGCKINLTFLEPHLWQIYTEPKKKVTLYKFALKTGGEWWETGEFYENKEIAESKLRIGPVVRLDYTATEFEVE